MAVSLVQSVQCGHASQSGSGTGTINCTGNFPSNTTAGNFIVAACFTYSTGQTPSSVATLTTPGQLWTVSGSFSNSDITGGIWKGTGVWGFIGNTSSIPSSTLTTWQVQFNSTALTRVDHIEFVMFEFAGVLQSASPIAFEDFGTTNIGTSSTPDCGTLPVTASDLILGAMIGETGNISPNANYTLAFSLPNTQFAQVQYLLNGGPGSIPSAWVGTQAKWAAGAQAIFPAPFTPPPVTPTTFSIQKLILSVRESNVPVRGRN